jgi:hypothetical protein
MDVAKARRLVSILPPKLLSFFTRYPPRNPSLRTLYSQEDKSVLIAKRLHDFQSVPTNLHQPVTTDSQLPSGKSVATVYLPFQNPFKPSRDPRSGNFHAPKYSLRRQADLIKLALRFGVAELLPPSEKGNKLLYGRKRPMVGTIRPKGTYEERTRSIYVEKKRKALEDSLRVVAMRKTVLLLSLLKGGLLMRSGGILRRVGNGDRVPHGIDLKNISDRLLIYLRILAILLAMHCIHQHFLYLGL